MAEPTTQTQQTPVTPQTPKTVAGNITKAINERANGKALTPTPPAQEPQKTPEPVQVDPNAGKEKYVVDGKEIWLLPEQARAYVQKGIAFEPKMDQLNRLQQESGAFMQALISDPLSVLKNISKQRNIPIEQIYEKVLDGDWPESVKEIVGKRYYGNVVEPLKLSPEELELRDLRKKQTETERREALARDMAIKQENQKKVEAALNEIKIKIGEAMKESGLPNNDTPLGAEMARMVADVMRVARFRQEIITPKQAIEKVKSRIKEVQMAYYDSLEDEALVKEIGEVNAEKVKKYFLKLAKAADKSVPVDQKSPALKGRSGERKTMNMDEFREHLENLKKSG